MIYELLIFGVIAFVAVAVLAAMVIAVGMPFGMSPQLAIPIAVYILLVLFPGGGNLWIAATGRDGEDAIERVAAGVRGIALIVGWTAFIFLLAPREEWSPFFPYLLVLCGLCVFLFIWSIWREDRHQHKKLEDKGLIRDD